MIEWKEREHEMDDITALRSPRTQASLRACGLLKFFKLQKMKSEVLLLEHIIGLWDINEQGFHIGAQLLTIELEDVYFLTGLSKRGVPIAFIGQRTLPEQVDVYLARHCVPGARLVGGRIPIKDIRDLLFDPYCLLSLVRLVALVLIWLRGHRWLMASSV
jgi:hypothetical protein